MKKIIFMLAAVAAMMSMNAQSLNDNAYISLRGGASGLLHPNCNGYENFGHTIEGQVSLQAGWWLTPKFAVGVEATTGFENGSRTGLFQGRNWLNHLDVLALAKVNLNNVFRGYRGVADRFEFVPTVGIGWVHGWTYAFDGGTQHSNCIMTKYALDVNYNVSEKVQINFSPFLAYNLNGVYQNGNNPKFDARNAWWGLELGVSYKFGKGLQQNGGYTQADIDALNAEINELRSRSAEVQTVEKPVEVIVEKPVVKRVYSDIIISFANNSCELTQAEAAKLQVLQPGIKVAIVGSATKTGSEGHNVELSRCRATVVADYLRSIGITDVTADGVGSDLDMRVAVVKVVED